MNRFENQRIAGSTIAGGLALGLLYWTLTQIFSESVSAITELNPSARTLLATYQILAAALGALAGFLIAWFRLGWIFSVIAGFICGALWPLVATIVFHLFTGIPFTYLISAQNYGGIGRLIVIVIIGLGMYGFFGMLAGLVSKSYMRFTEPAQKPQENFQQPPPPPEF